jgi:hypothetical protein
LTDFLLRALFTYCNPHGLKAISKLTASGWKEPLPPHPLHSTMGGRGEGVASSAALKIGLIKTYT